MKGLRRSNLWRYSLIVFLLLVGAGVVWAGYYGWESLADVEDQVASVREEQLRLAGRLADLTEVVGAISLEITDESLTRKVDAIAADLRRLRGDVDRLASLTGEHAQRIIDLDTEIVTLDRALGEATGQFWSSFQDRNLDELNDAVIGVEAYLIQVNGQLTSIESYLDDVDAGLRRIESCLSRFSDFLPGC